MKILIIGMTLTISLSSLANSISKECKTIMNENVERYLTQSEILKSDSEVTESEFSVFQKNDYIVAHTASLICSKSEQRTAMDYYLFERNLQSLNK